MMIACFMSHVFKSTLESCAHRCTRQKSQNDKQCTKEEEIIKSEPGKGRRELSQSLILSLIFFPGKNHGYFFLVSFSYFSKIVALNIFQL